MSLSPSSAAMNFEHAEILVIDPHPILRDGIVAVLSSALAGTRIEGCATFPEALARTRNSSVDLVVSAFRVDGETVMPFLQVLKNTRSRTRTLILSALDEIQVGAPCIRAGASGFVKKSSPVSVIVEAVRSVLAGNHHISERLSKALMERRGVDTPTSPGTHLTPCELCIFSMIGQCLSVSMIAQKLGVSVKTVEAHREHIKNKLGYANAASVAAAAVRWLDEASVIV